MGVGRVHRLIRLITLLQSERAWSVRELAEQLGVSRRTLFRDLNVLEMAGVPYYHEPNRGYRIARSFFLPPVNLTVTETLGLMLLTKQALAQRGRPMADAALSAVVKLLSTVPEPMRSACADLMEPVSIRLSAQVADEAEARHHQTFQRCIDEGRVCKMTYKSPVEAQSATLLVKPLALHFSSRAWYVFARTDQHKDVRLFKLVRIEQLEPTDRLFTPPKRFDPAAWIGQAWQLIPEGRCHHVELEFSPRVATNVMEVRWHPTQKQNRLPDGRCHMSFDVDGLNEITWWICGYADQVLVLKPTALRERVRQMHEAAAKQARSSKTGIPF
ncbi:MAG: YafY family transcriptional regulator [Phycisphaeraceae bacterium]|nr:YafY family transcriptional regulator [Phycisphaeraceae bacterium]